MDVLTGPDSEQLESIRIQLNEDEERFENNRKLLQQWIAYQPHLPQNYDEELLGKFLRGCKHNLEKAKKKFETYFVARTSYPEFYAKRTITKEEIDTMMQYVDILPLPKLTPEGRRVTVMRLGPLVSISPSAFDLDSSLRLLFIIADIRLLREGPLAGDIFISDCKGTTMELIPRFIRLSLIKALSCTYDAYPHRFYSCHVVNVPSFAEKSYKLVKSLFKEKLRDRIMLHNSPEDLLNYIPKDILPPEYHGTGANLDTLRSKWSKYIMDHAEWFRKQENVKATGPAPNNLSQAYGWDDNFGLGGTFRQLAID